MLSAAWKVLMGATPPTVVSLNRVEHAVGVDTVVFTQAERMLAIVLSSWVGSTMLGSAVVPLATPVLYETRLLAGPKALFRPVMLVEVVPMLTVVAVTEAKGASA